VLLQIFRLRFLCWIIFGLSLFPVMRDWDSRIWPSESEVASRLERRYEAVQLRALALDLLSSQQQAFLAPWWLSPSIAYWSGQPGVAGSSHESLPGIVDSARFFLATDSGEAREILKRRGVSWIFVYDADRVESNSAALLGIRAPGRDLCRILDQEPSRAPEFLGLAAQNGTGKLFQVANKW